MGRVIYALNRGLDVSSKAELPYRQFCPETKQIILPEYINKVFNYSPDAWKDLKERITKGNVEIKDSGEGHGLTLANMLNIAIEIPLFELQIINPLHEQASRAKAYTEKATQKQKELFFSIINHAYLNSTCSLRHAFAQQILPEIQVGPVAQKLSTFMRLSKRLDELAASIMSKPE